MTVTGDGTWLRPPSSTPSSTLHAAARATDANQTGVTSEIVPWDDDRLDTDGYLIDSETIEIPAGLSGWYVVEAEIVMSVGNVSFPATHHQQPEGWIYHFHAIGSTTQARSQDTFNNPYITEYVPNGVGGSLHFNTGVIGCADGDQFWLQVNTDSDGETLGGGGWCHMSILKVG